MVDIIYNSKWYNCWIKTMVVLSLSLFLYADKCPGSLGKPTVADYIVQHSDKEILYKNLKHIDDISLPQGERGGRDLFYAAVSRGDKEQVALFLERINEDNKNKNRKNTYETSGFPNHVDQKHKKTALGKAITNKDYPIIKLLLANPHINVNKVSHIASTSLVWALQQKSYKIAELLLENNNIDVTTPDPESGNTPLHLVLKNRNARLFGLLWPKLSEAKEVLCAKNKKNQSPLHIAVGYSKDIGAFSKVFNGIIKLMTKEEAVKQLFEKDHCGRSVFITAAKCSNWLHVDTKLFKAVLYHVRNILSKENWDNIEKEIDTVQMGEMSGGKKTLKELHDIVGSMRTITSNPSIPQKVKKIKQD